MSGIFGMVSGEGEVRLIEQAHRMDSAMAHWGPDGHGLWHDTRCALGQRLLFNTPESPRESLPRLHTGHQCAFTAEGRLDNRDELLDLLEIPSSDRATLPDGDLMLSAYARWGEDTPPRLKGDWSFAAWHPAERRLCLARDHHGNTALFYWQTDGQFAFASDPHALLAIGAPRRLNELHLAQLLISWATYHGPGTIHLDINRLPPAHAMRVTPQGVRTWRYWRLEDTPLLHLRDRREYVDGLLDVYDTAVRCRLRSYRPIGTTLSGGLDSGSVTALAARALGQQGRRLAAFTSVPRVDVSHLLRPSLFGDETPFAKATASRYDNIDHHLIDASDVTPISAVRRTLATIGAPTHAASNAYWILSLLDRAHTMGIGTLLSGQGGNATISWTGAPELRSLGGALARKGWKGVVRRLLPSPCLRPLLRLRGETWASSAIHPDFARRIGLFNRRVTAAGHDPTLQVTWREPRDHRCAVIQPGRAIVGDLWARNGAAAGLEVRDPTHDVRVMAFTLSVPDEVFDAPDGQNRWLIRAAMEGLLPDEVRLNRQRGRQAADLGSRLLQTEDEVEAALSEVDAPPANAYLDVAKLRRAWQNLRREVSEETTHRAMTILLRGLMAGFFLQDGARLTVAPNPAESPRLRADHGVTR